MEKCYQYFSCIQAECTVYKKEELNCWEVEGTLCHYPGVGRIQSILSGEGRDQCALCIYYNRIVKSEVVFSSR